MKTRTALLLTMALVPSLLLPIAAQAAPHPKAAVSVKPAKTMYACTICHHQVTAAEAKKLHYTCPVDHGKLVAVKPAAKAH